MERDQKFFEKSAKYCSSFFTPANLHTRDFVFPKFSKKSLILIFAIRTGFFFPRETVTFKKG